MGNQFSQTILTMKFLAAVLLLATLAQARPRYMMVPFDDEYETPQVRFIQHQPYLNRQARSAFPQEPVAPAPGGFKIPDGIRAAEGLIASGSGPSPAIAGGDAVDYELILADMVLSGGTQITPTMKELDIVVK